MRLFGKSAKVSPAPNEPSAVPIVKQQSRKVKVSQPKRSLKPIKEEVSVVERKKQLLADALKNF